MKYFTLPKLTPRPKLDNRRSGRDRRKRRWSNLIWLFKKGRRRSMRRSSDKRDVRILDYYSPKLLYTLTLVLLLSLGDAFLTLWLIGHGAQELNPIMAYFLQFGPYVFLSVKYFLTAMAVVIVVLLNYAVLRYPRLKLRVLMPLFASCFALVVVWELFLITHMIL